MEIRRTLIEQGIVYESRPICAYSMPIAAIRNEWLCMSNLPAAARNSAVLVTAGGQLTFRRHSSGGAQMPRLLRGIEPDRRLSELFEFRDRFLPVLASPRVVSVQLRQRQTRCGFVVDRR